MAQSSPEATNSPIFKALVRYVLECWSDIERINTFFHYVGLQLKTRHPGKDPEVDLDLIEHNGYLKFRFLPTAVADKSRTQEIGSLLPGRVVLCLAPGKTESDPTSLGDLRDISTSAALETAARDSVQRFFADAP